MIVIFRWNRFVHHHNEKAKCKSRWESWKHDFIQFDNRVWRRRCNSIDRKDQIWCDRWEKLSIYHEYQVDYDYWLRNSDRFSVHARSIHHCYCKLIQNYFFDCFDHSLDDFSNHKRFSLSARCRLIRQLIFFCKINSLKSFELFFVWNMKSTSLFNL